MHLGERAGEHQRHGQREEDNGQPQRRKNFDEPTKEHGDVLLILNRHSKLVDLMAVS
jgi:hypothetical protein